MQNLYLLHATWLGLAVGDYMLIEPKWLGLAHGWSDYADGGFIEPWSEPQQFYVQQIPELPPGQNPMPGTSYISVCQYPQRDLDIWQFKMNGPDDRPPIRPMIQCFDETGDPGAFFTPRNCCNVKAVDNPKVHEACWPGVLKHQQFICCMVYEDFWIGSIFKMVPDWSYDLEGWTAWKNTHRVGHHPPPRMAWESSKEDYHGALLELYDLMLKAGVPAPPVGYINIGAADGVAADPLHDLILARRLVGIAVEQDEEAYGKLNNNLGEVEQITRTINQWATPSNIQELILEHADLWPADAPTRDLFVLKIDIDSWECPLMERAVEVISPYFIHVETNMMYPPPVQYSMGYNAKVNMQDAYNGTSYYPISGCSVSYVVERMMQKGYYLYTMQSADTVLIRKDIAPLFEPLHPAEYNEQGEMTSHPLKFPMDEIEVYRNMYIWVSGVNVGIVREWFFHMHEDPDDYLARMYTNTTKFSKFMKVQDIPILLNINPGS